MWSGIKDGLGPGITATVGYSVEHPDQPIVEGFFAPTQRQNYDIMMSGVEKNPNGPGIKFIQCKTIEMGGYLPAFMTDKGSQIMPSINFKCWCAVLDKVARGEALDGDNASYFKNLKASDLLGKI